MLLDTVTVSAFTALAKLIGAGKSVAMARVFGAGTALDAYLLAFLVPSFLADVFCGSLVPVMVPKFIELTNRESRTATAALYSHALRRSLWLAGGAAAVVAAGGAILATAGANSARTNLHTLGVLTILMAPILPIAAVTNIWRAVLNSQGRFAIAAVTIALTPTVIILCIVFFGKSQGVWILAAGTSLASVVEVAVLGCGLRKAGFPILPGRCERCPSLVDIRRELGYLAAATATSAGSAFLGQSMAAALGAGSVSLLNYGTRLAAVLMAIGPAALSVTILPRFSQLAVTGDREQLKQSLWRILALSVVLAAALAAILIVFSVPIVRMSLQRGAFTAADTRLVASVQAFSLLQLPFILGITILTRALSALQANRILLPFSGLALLLNTGLNYALMTHYGVAGLALATSTAQALLFFALAFLVFRRGLGGFLKGSDAGAAFCP